MKVTHPNVQESKTKSNRKNFVTKMKETQNYIGVPIEGNSGEYREAGL